MALSDQQLPGLHQNQKWQSKCKHDRQYRKWYNAITFILNEASRTGPSTQRQPLIHVCVSDPPVFPATILKKSSILLGKVVASYKVDYILDWKERMQ